MSEKPTVPPLAPSLLDILVCPLTKGPLSYDRKNQELISRKAKLAFPIREGIPYLLADQARPLKANEES
ncbi:MAG: Trm112 family protein [Pseudomonadota bacterium]